MDLDWLLQQPENARDQAWEAAVLDGLINTKVQLQSAEPQEGPDGWPYLFARTGADATEPFSKLVEWLAGRGIGLVVNAHKMLPDYVFTYGMLWSFVETGRFLDQDADRIPTGEIDLSTDGSSVMGAPTEKYLPPYVRAVLRDFLSQQGFQQPRILVVSQVSNYRNTDLVFSLESLRGIEGKDQKTMAEALSWFLPMHYSLVFASEKNLPPFHAL